VGEGEMMVVTWKRFEGAYGEQRARPSPGAFLRICRRRGGETRDGVSSSAYSPSEGGGRFVYDRRKRDGAEGVQVCLERKGTTRPNSF
jgi:hypothetical protein